MNNQHMFNCDSRGMPGYVSMECRGGQREQCAFQEQSPYLQEPYQPWGFQQYPPYYQEPHNPSNYQEPLQSMDFHQPSPYLQNPDQTSCFQPIPNDDRKELDELMAMAMQLVASQESQNEDISRLMAYQEKNKEMLGQLIVHKEELETQKSQLDSPEMQKEGLGRLDVDYNDFEDEGNDIEQVLVEDDLERDEPLTTSGLEYERVAPMIILPPLHHNPLFEHNPLPPLHHNPLFQPQPPQQPLQPMIIQPPFLSNSSREAGPSSPKGRNDFEEAVYTPQCSTSNEDMFWPSDDEDDGPILKESSELVTQHFESETSTFVCALDQDHTSEGFTVEELSGGATTNDDLKDGTSTRAKPKHGRAKKILMPLVRTIAKWLARVDRRVFGMEIIRMLLRWFGKLSSRETSSLRAGDNDILARSEENDLVNPPGFHE